MEPVTIEIMDKEEMTLIGSIFYGDPFHSSNSWNEENEIGLTWKRFNKCFEKHEKLLQEHVVNPDIGYELHIEPEDKSKNTKKFYVFTGVEVTKLDEMPLDFFYKVIPPSKFVRFVFRGKEMFSGPEYIYKEWLSKSDYQEAYPLLIEAYDANRFKDGQSEDSELDYYIPIKPKE
ncbi:MAG: GyrI-like domain-containing protein [Candidatus Hodarchaeales archaeon]|jgi:AraC family transcriptional regulator